MQMGGTLVTSPTCLECLGTREQQLVPGHKVDPYVVHKHSREKKQRKLIATAPLSLVLKCR